ncbi:transglycosylase SLT domain-containing protein [Candidatus Binatia bacterium]|nr:transglycosylase SLT domain-containing protein [Candidatus Binatia bacterium]
MSRAGVLLLLSTLVLTIAATAARAEDDPFPRPRVLQPAIAFWRDIFAKYSEHQVVVHDDWYLGKVYEVLDFRSWVEDGQPLTMPQINEKKRQVEEAEARVRDILLRLDANGGSADGLGPDEHKVAKMFADVDGDDKFRLAADRIRTQAGLRERFALGIARQRPYLARMERIFGEEGMPPQLARLPLIESCFDVNAYSKVGAAGVWQFMPSTGRQYMMVNDAVDERKDPLRATRAAARHLMADYDALGEWPLAITAYNHGRGGVARGTDEVSSVDIGDVVMGYRGKAFGFASRNFYAEFLAALDVSSRADELFGDLPRMPSVEGEEVELPHPMGIHQAASLAGVGREDLIVANPALLSSVTDGRAYMPRGYRLRIPSGGDAVQVANAEPPPRVERVEVASRKATRRVSTLASAKSRRGVATASAAPSGRPGAAAKKSSAVVVHRVKPGQTLGGIARQYGTTVEAIRDHNKVGKSVQSGQRLRIPS